MDKSFAVEVGKYVIPTMRNERVFMEYAANVETEIRNALRCIRVGHGGSERCLTQEEKLPFYIAAQQFAARALELKFETAAVDPHVSTAIKPPARRMLLAANDAAYMEQTASARHHLLEEFADYPAVARALSESIDVLAREMHQIGPLRGH